jgi:hypothetical protein
MRIEGGFSCAPSPKTRERCRLIAGLNELVRKRPTMVLRTRCGGERRCELIRIKPRADDVRGRIRLDQGALRLSFA